MTTTARQMSLTVCQMFPTTFQTYKTTIMMYFKLGKIAKTTRRISIYAFTICKIGFQL